MQNRRNVPKGILGALIGAIPGVALWVLLSKVGIIASICGIVILIGVVLGYTALGKKLDMVGIVISIIVVIFSVYFATNLSWALELHKFLKDADGSYSLVWCMKHLTLILDLADCKGSFIKDLVIGYLFTIVGAGSYIHKVLKK